MSITFFAADVKCEIPVNKNNRGNSTHKPVVRTKNVLRPKRSNDRPERSRIRTWTYANTNYFSRKLSFFIVIVSHLHWYGYTDICHCYIIRLGHTRSENIVIFRKYKNIKKSDFVDIFDIYQAYAHTLLKYKIHYQIVACVCALHRLHDMFATSWQLYQTTVQFQHLCK